LLVAFVITVLSDLRLTCLQEWQPRIPLEGPEQAACSYPLSKDDSGSDTVEQRDNKRKRRMASFNLVPGGGGHNYTGILTKSIVFSGALIAFLAGMTITVPL
jgi:hypothetical protein